MRRPYASRRSSRRPSCSSSVLSFPSKTARTQFAPLVACASQSSSESQMPTFTPRRRGSRGRGGSSQAASTPSQKRKMPHFVGYLKCFDPGTDTSA